MDQREENKPDKDAPKKTSKGDNLKSKRQAETDVQWEMIWGQVEPKNNVFDNNQAGFLMISRTYYQL